LTAPVTRISNFKAALPRLMTTTPTSRPFSIRNAPTRGHFGNSDTSSRTPPGRTKPANCWNALGFGVRSRNARALPFGSFSTKFGYDPRTTTAYYQLVEHFDSLRVKYERAADRLWLFVGPDPPEPTWPKAVQRRRGSSSRGGVGDIPSVCGWTMPPLSVFLGVNNSLLNKRIQ
jgi:hypothetical protein